ncbi:PIN domain-containing protein [Lentzea sp. JNUCC 0626]|uniref:PIN domain-containing protein n=1 Tax=Lentzea sp. JNUCC 0626 TaxID=3367513 RepID=UPI0037490205
MRDAFYGHYPLTEDEETALWAQALIVLDTNALLNMYRYSPRAREELHDALSMVKDRLWMPHQVGCEFHSNRVKRILEQLSIEKSVSSALDDIENVTKSNLGKFRKNAFVSTDELSSLVVSAIGEARKKLASAREERDQSYGISVREDPILTRLANLYEGRVGSGYSDSEMVEVVGQADARYERSEPPGYKDKSKEGMEKYGDYLIWRQILDYASANQRDVIFVTDDGKEDWWRIVRHDSVGKAILGPRVELRDEFRMTTSRLFFMYTPEEFLRRLHSVVETRLSSEVVVEVREASQESNRLASIQLERARALEELRDIERSMDALDERLAEADRRILRSKEAFRVLGHAEAELATCADRRASLSADRVALAERLNGISAERDIASHEKVDDKEAVLILNREEERTRSHLRVIEFNLQRVTDEEHAARARYSELAGMSFDHSRIELREEEERAKHLSREREMLGIRYEEARNRFVHL